MSDTEPVERTWDQRIFDKVPSGVDPSIIRENLKLTPTERVEKMLRALDLANAVRKATHANRPSSDPRGAR